MLPLHIGMHVRFLQHLDLARGVVKDAEGTAVHGEIEPEDAGEVEIARCERRPTYLRHVPMGVGLRMDHADCATGPVSFLRAKVCPFYSACVPLNKRLTR